MMNKDIKVKYCIAVDSGSDNVFYYNGDFVDKESEFKGFFLFFDKGKDKCEYNIPWSKVIWVKELGQ